MPIDMVKKLFQVEDNIAFNPWKLDVSCNEKKLLTDAVSKILELIKLKS